MTDLPNYDEQATELHRRVSNAAAVDEMTSDLPKPNLADIKRTHSDGERCRSAHCDVPALIRALEAVIEANRKPYQALLFDPKRRTEYGTARMNRGSIIQADRTLDLINQHLNIGETK